MTDIGHLALPVNMDVFTRTPGAGKPESGVEKLVVLPKMDDQDPSDHAWADAWFA